MRLDKRTDPRVASYIRGVLDGSVPAGKLVRAAVERHLADLESGHLRGLRFDYTAAQTALDFCGLVKHSKGEWAGRVFEPTGWQCFILWCLFGWLRSDGRRRYREALVEVARKNGKTFLAAVIALILLVLDQEPGAEVYAAATKRDQAKLVWEDAAAVVRASPALAQRINVLRSNMSIPLARAKFEPLSADHKTADGLNPHGVINDELHRHKDRGLYDVLKTGTGARRQPLILDITTAGDEDPETVYSEIHGYGIQVAEGVVEDDAFFVFIATLDPEDDWKDEAVWHKPNPNLGVSVYVDNLREAFQQALKKPAEEAAFKRLRLNVRTTSATPWIRLEDWNACYDPALVGWNGFDGKECFVGLDLASTTDLTARATVFQVGDTVCVQTVAWVPEDNLARRADIDRAPYPLWVKDGWLRVTPGNSTDYRYIEQDLVGHCRRYVVKEVGFDQALSYSVAPRLQDAGVPMVAVPQGPVNMTAPLTQLEDLVLSRKLRHDGNPLLRWCVMNAMVKPSSGELKRIIKTSSRARIDAVVALLMALARMTTMAPAPANSYSDDRYFGGPAPLAGGRPLGGSYANYGEEAP